ncbi:unnamed protein product [Candidula unifasciata]|uniref:HEAT repeat-containing protein 6 n=1 Tax=Candidula unifasciata TaxID=100452 RepID=A0A8S3Z2Y4_9EUPU|nr:unnamed protein product [Candidula unifasciata]
MAASSLAFDETEARQFRDCVGRLQKFAFYDDEKSRSSLSLLLDELLAVESYVCSFHSEHEGSAVLAYLARVVPLHLDRIVAKVCHLIVNFCAHKNVALATNDLHTLVKFLTDSLTQCPSFVHAEILSALCVVCENNTHRIEKFHDVLVGGKGLLLQLTDDTTCDDDVVVEAVRCLALFTGVGRSHADCIEVRHLSASFDTFVHLLHRAPHMKMDTHMRNKLLMHCFSGIQNIIVIKRLPNIELGFLFAAVRAYMFYGLTSHSLNIPSQLYPNVVTPYDPLVSSKTLSKAAGDAGRREVNKSADTSMVKSSRGLGTSEAASSDRSQNKKLRKRKGRGRSGDLEEDKEKASVVEERPAWSSAVEVRGAPWSDITPEAEAQDWEADWLKLSSSESEFSDTEGGKARQQKSEMVRVRQSALNCFLNIVRIIDKKIMFGYWSSFIPDVGFTASTPQLQQSLFTTILRDPSPRCRMAAVASLTSMLESTKPYLAAAEEISTHQSAFTPFSTILGSMIRDMHRCLLQALVAENFKSVLTQIIKCLANLVSNVPYHRLNPGLLSRVLKQIRHFYNHKDPNVRTACLTCIGAIVGIKPPLMEVSQLIKPPHNPVGVASSAHPSDSPLFRPQDASYLLYPSFGTAQVLTALEENQKVTDNPRDAQRCLDLSEAAAEKNAADSNDTSSFVGPQAILKPDTGDLHLNDRLKNGLTLTNTKLNPDAETFRPVQEIEHPINNFDESTQINETSFGSGYCTDTTTPVLGASSGMATPVFLDQLLQKHARETSWVIKLCIKNITGQPDIPCEESHARVEAFQKFEPLPIRLEALQVLSCLIRNYFPVIRQSFDLLQNLVQKCLEDPNHIVKLHGVKVLDELTQVLQKDVADASISPNHVIPFQQVLDFWLYLLEGPLPELLKFNPEMSIEGNNLVRSGACECMANIGEEVFAKLPTARQMQCVTLVLGLAGDEDKLIRASAVRALGVYIMYSGLKEDVAFVLDAGKAILSCMGCPSNCVRFKAAWALANLCDTLVLNKDKQVQDFVTDFPHDLLLQLVQCAASSTKESDKISCNAVRAIGNLVRYMPTRCFLQSDMEKAVEAAVRGLIKNMNSGTMKVRWNSCYAASNAFQNPELPMDRTWVTDILNMLSKVVQNCTNFKVRINAALGLSAPSARQGYGSPETVSNVWASLVLALETAENINNFAEYKYKDSLTEHLCGAVLHVTSLIELADLSALSQQVHIKGHSFRIFMEKYVKLRLAKKVQSDIPSLEKVRGHLQRLESSATSDDQRRCLQALLQACVPDTDSADERTPEKTSFQQTYD